MACPSDKRKMTENGANGYFCEACQKAYADAIPTYNFSIRVSDCSGTLILSCFGDIGDSILGINAREFHQMHEDVAAVKELTMNVLHTRQLALVVRGKLDEGRGGFSAEGPSVRYTAVRAATHSFQSANESLLAQLKAYEAMPETGAAEEMADVGGAFF